MDDDRKKLISRVKRYAKSAKCAESVASLRVFKSGGRLAQLEAGSRIWPDTIKAANATLDRLEKDIG